MSRPCLAIQSRILAAHLDEESFETGPRLLATLDERDLSHLGGCADCQAFQRRQGELARRLGELERRSGPAELDLAVDLALGAEGQRERVLAAVVGLERREVPAALDDAIERHLAGAPPVTPRWARALERRTAPAVLDRLVEEELADPAAASVRRFAGSLERLRAPGVLGTHTHRALTGRFLPARGRRASLAAAALVLVAVAFGLVIRGGAGPEQAFGLRVTKVSSLSQLDPLARQLLDGLSGGVVTAIER